MNALFDTCVLSEYAKRAPHAGVIAWLDMQPESGLFISSLSLAEIEKGILNLAGTNVSGDASNAKRAKHLTVWLGKLTERFFPIALLVDAAVWRVWAPRGKTCLTFSWLQLLKGCHPGLEPGSMVASRRPMGQRAWIAGQARNDNFRRHPRPRLSVTAKMNPGSSPGDCCLGIRGLSKYHSA